MRHVVYREGDDFSFQKDITSFSVADGVKEIKSGAFRGCIGISSLENLLDSKLFRIGQNAFLDCINITSLRGVPSSVAEIGFQAFGGTGITSLLCDITFNRIGDRAFPNCNAITSLDGLSPCVFEIRPRAFTDCAGIASVGAGFIPNCVVAPDAFQGCTLLHNEAASKGFSSIESWGKAVWRAKLRCAVLSSVKVARRLIDACGSDANAANKGKEVSELLLRLSLLPSGDQNSTGTEGQVLRHIVGYVGFGLSLDQEEIIAVKEEEVVSSRTRSHTVLKRKFAPD
jgi:hypothetical protein